MPFPLYAVFAAAVLTLLTKVPVFVAMAREGRGYDNNHPRDQQARLVGWGRRALAAHMNAFEAFPLFAAGAIAAVVSGADPTWAARLCIGFLALRVLYTALYIADIAALRSVSWFGATACSFTLMILKAIAG